MGCMGVRVTVASSIVTRGNVWKSLDTIAHLALFFVFLSPGLCACHVDWNGLYKKKNKLGVGCH